MAVTKDDFEKIWASTSPLTPYEFSESNYKEGWNFIGATPPSRQMWDFLQKNTDEKIKYIYTNMIPCGIVQAFAGNTVPEGWLLCDGSAVSRTDYAELYAVIGDTYGAGDGTDTFNLPDLVDKFIQGNATSGTEHSAGLPNIEGDISQFGDKNYGLVSNTTNSGNGALYNKISGNGHSATPPDESGAYHSAIYFDASRSNSIYGNSTTVQPPALTMQYIIKY